MAARTWYALHRPAGTSGALRLFRFHALAIRGKWANGDPARWRGVPEALARGPARRADAARGWKYEAPGVWSAPVGTLRSAWWRWRLW